jgi:hypothetical protein
MSRSAYWTVTVLALAFVLFGIATFDLPNSEVVELSLLEQFYQSAYLAAGLTGLVVGVLGAWLAKATLRHVPHERGTEYAARVGWRGLGVAVSAVAIAALVTVPFAISADLDPLAPMERIVLVSYSGRYFVVLVIAFVMALLAYAATTRAPTWGGQYALIKRI